MKRNLSEILPLIGMYQQSFSPEAKAREALLTAQARFAEQSAPMNLEALALANAAAAGGIEQQGVQTQGLGLGNQFNERSMDSRLAEMAANARLREGLVDPAIEQANLGVADQRFRVDEMNPLMRQRGELDVQSMQTRNTMDQISANEARETSAARVAAANMLPRATEAQIGATDANRQGAEADALLRNVQSASLVSGQDPISRARALEQFAPQINVDALVPGYKIPPAIRETLAPYRGIDVNQDGIIGPGEKPKLDPSRMDQRAKLNPLIEKILQDYPDQAMTILSPEMLEFYYTTLKR